MDCLGFDKDEGRPHELRLTREFYHNIDPVLRAATMENALWWFNRFAYVTTITSVNRTKDENEAVGGYEFSGHLTGHALDKRTRNMSESFRRKYMARLEYNYQKTGLYLIYHNNHLHCGIKRAFQKGTWV